MTEADSRSREEVGPKTGELCQPSHLRKPRLRRQEACEYLAFVHGLVFAPSTLAKLACVGGGPSYQKSGRIPLYPVKELDRWAIERLGGLMRNSSDYSGAKAKPQTGIDPTPIPSRITGGIGALR